MNWRINPWHKFEYHFYLVFGEKISGKEPWLEGEWINNFEPLFNKIIEISSYKNDTGLRVLEYKKEQETDKYYKEYKLGRLKWDRKSHEKWTLKNNDKRIFHHYQSWTPLWTICEKNDRPPDVYIAFSDERSIYGNDPLQFDILVIIAISVETGNIPKEIIIELSKLFKSKRTVYNKRTWGNGKNDEDKKWAFQNSIPDTFSGQMYKESGWKIINESKTNMHTINFNDIKFEPYWEIIY
jgi:hypothetical protein